MDDSSLSLSTSTLDHLGGTGDANFLQLGEDRPENGRRRSLRRRVVLLEELDEETCILKGLVGSLSKMLGGRLVHYGPPRCVLRTYGTGRVSCIADEEHSALMPRLQLRTIIQAVLVSYYQYSFRQRTSKTYLCDAIAILHKLSSVKCPFADRRLLELFYTGGIQCSPSFLCFRLSLSNPEQDVSGLKNCSGL